jgi:hypothetical protein
MSEVKVDTISERTAAGGVTIDGVLIKDGIATFQTAAGSPLVFEGATADAFETTFAITDPTADRTITFPDSSFTVPTAGGAFASYAILADQKTSGSAAGTFTSGAWQTRDLQTEIYDGIGISIATNAFTLPAGDYLIKWYAPAYKVSGHQSRLYDVTGTAEIEVGGAGYTPAPVIHAGGNVLDWSLGAARVSPSGANAYRIEHRCGVTFATDGFGVRNSWGVEQFTLVEVFKES